MHVNNEQTNTQRMLEHNRSKDRVYKGSLERKITNVALGNIDRTESTILNCEQYSFEKLENLLSNSSAGFVQSDADPQIIIKIKFVEKVDCHSIHFHPFPSESSENSSPPRIVKLFVNQPSLDFSDIDSALPTHSIELPFEYADNKPFLVNLALTGAKFSRISSLQILIDDNFGTDQTAIGRIQIEGSIVPSYHTEFK